MAIKRIWIEDGCTGCALCEDACSEVFSIEDEISVVNEEADFSAFEDAIKQSVEECPVEVIMIEEG
ncbi:unnamed protein product [marine sediment metagenome]|uniref:4Fe-4S ferredoxin-type domain-containing protein n=1 Tax=marine sediment metagenome TaxID=412755 RepID=X1CG66_9ZZZZ